jgi:hypothetical protein
MVDWAIRDHHHHHDNLKRIRNMRKQISWCEDELDDHVWDESETE